LKVLDKGSKVWFKPGSYQQMLRKFLKSESSAQVKLGPEVSDYLENRLSNKKENPKLDKMNFKKIMKFLHTHSLTTKEVVPNRSC
jgi:hypothetical protein